MPTRYRPAGRVRTAPVVPRRCWAKSSRLTWSIRANVALVAESRSSM
jgi:hypothetical protein